MDSVKRFRRNLFNKYDQVSEERNSDRPSGFAKRRKLSIFTPDISFEKDTDDILPSIEGYMSSDDDDDDEINETIKVECFSEQDDYEITRVAFDKHSRSSPEIIDCSGSETSEKHLSLIRQPVADSEDENYSIASEETLYKSPNFSICSSPEVNFQEFPSSPSDVISVSPFMSPNIKSENKIMVSEFKTPDKKITIRNASLSSPDDVISESPFKSPNIKSEDNMTKESKCLNWKFKTPDNKLVSKNPAYNSDRKRKKYIKGGFAEQFEKLSLKEQSDQAIWRHQRQRLCRDTERCNTILTLKVIDIRKEYSNIFVICKNLKENLNMIVTGAYIGYLKLEAGNIIKVYSPWLSLKLERVKSNAICANFIEVIDRCSQYFPKLSRCVFDWTSQCTNDSSCIIDSEDSLLLSSSQRNTTTNFKSRLNPLDSILDIDEEKEFYLIAYVRRVFYYFHQKVKTWSLLLQDKNGYFAELLLKFVDSKLLPIVMNAEGKLFCLGAIRFLQKIRRNRSAKLFSMINSLENRSDIKFNNHQQFCFILTSIPEKFTIIGKNNFESRMSCETQTVAEILQNSSDGDRYSSIIKILCIYESKLFVTDESCISTTHQNYIVVIQTDEVIQCSNLGTSCILYLKDFQFSCGTFFLDKCSRVYCLTCENNEELTIKRNQIKIEKLKQFFPILPNLTALSKLEELVSVTGTIIKPDDETSFSWPVCDACYNEMLHELENGKLFCNECFRTVKNPVVKMQLEVFIKSQFMSANMTVKLRLMKHTIENLLPSAGDDRSYDVECILNKQIGPVKCFIEQVCPVDDTEYQIYILREL